MRTDLGDTPDEVIERQFDLLRAMTGAQRLELMRSMTVAVQRLALAGMKRRHPCATDEELWLRVAANRLGRETVLKMYGFDVGAP